MTPIAFLASRDMLPGALNPRADAFEYGLTMAALVPAFASRGLALTSYAWDDLCVLDAEAALVGTTWDYWDRHGEFLAALEAIERDIPLYNPSALVRWNSDKQYLRELAERGAPSIPTVWLSPGDDLTPVFAALSTDRLVVKRQVGAGAYGQFLLERGQPVPTLTHRMLAQPFMPAIQEHGELSVVMIDGEVSHALVKRARPGDYRIQSMYGGSETPHTLSADEAWVARSMLDLLDEIPLYARVDLLLVDGKPTLMELELIEPYLYPEQGPQLGARLADAVVRRLGR